MPALSKDSWRQLAKTSSLFSAVKTISGYPSTRRKPTTRSTPSTIDRIVAVPELPCGNSRVNKGLLARLVPISASWNGRRTTMLASSAIRLITPFSPMSMPS
ncbi:hypothetical protein D3C73_1129010 [compost metagenome]